MKSPIAWYGGKGAAQSKIVPMLPPHDTYVEPFAGGASIFFGKRPARVEAINDVNAGLVNLYRVLQAPDMFARLYRATCVRPYSRTQWKRVQGEWRDCADPVEKAWRWLILARQSFGGKFENSWGFTVSPANATIPCQTVGNWLGCIQNLPNVHRRLQGVHIHEGDWGEVVAKYDSPTTLFYCDPPYFPETLKTEDAYDGNNLDREGHARLLDTLLSMQGMAVVSGYPHPAYDVLVERGWSVTKWSTACMAAGRTRHTGMKGAGAAKEQQPRTECVWMCPRASRTVGVQMGLGF